MSQTFALPHAAGEELHRITSLPVVVLSPHNRCNCRCVMCDIWKIRETRELSAADLRPHVDSFRRLNVRWIVFSGGEAQLHSDLASLTTLLRADGVHMTLLTAGLLLAEKAEETTAIFDDVIVSLDGPREVHDRIRRVPGAFERLRSGVAALRHARAGIPVAGRCTVQKENLGALRAVAAVARELGLDSISFLAADVASAAFNRPQPWTAARQHQVSLTRNDVEALADEIEALIAESATASFVQERPEKLRRIVRHFRAQLGEVEPRAPRCNAPWTSTVIDANGDVRPCFFHPPIGNLGDGPLVSILNGPAALQFRANLDIAANPVCRNCVCSLYWSDEKAAGLRP